MTEFIHVTKDGHLLIVTMNRPQKLNSLHAPACFELSAVWDEFEKDDDLWVAIITGAGEKAFCAGHDLADDPDEDMPDTGWAGMSERTMTKPVIAAVNGYALGGGFEIALASDIVIAGNNAVFALSEPRVGAVALGGGVQRLIRKMPAAVAMGLLLTGKNMSAEEACRWGVVTEVVAADAVLATARKWAGDIMACAPIAVRITKQLATESLEGREFGEMLGRQRRQAVDELFKTRDTHEGIAAFMEKRKPVWHGR
jgi:enoyl-CoA hydratase/carnithine racemase